MDVSCYGRSKKKKKSIRKIMLRKSSVRPCSGHCIAHTPSARLKPMLPSKSRKPEMTDMLPPSIRFPAVFRKAKQHTQKEYPNNKR